MRPTAIRVNQAFRRTAQDSRKLFCSFRPSTFRENQVIYITTGLRQGYLFSMRKTNILTTNKLISQFLSLFAECKRGELNYSRSSPCDHSSKRPALVTTSILKPRLNWHLNSVIKSSRKRPWPLLCITDGLFPLFLSSRKRPLSQHLNNSHHFFIKVRVVRNISDEELMTCTIANLCCDRQ